MSVQKDQSLSQKDPLRRLNRVIHLSNEQDFGLSGTIQDPLLQDCSFSIKSSDTLEDYAIIISHPKGYGDEPECPPTHPHVPLSLSRPKLQGVIDFLEAPPLSLTSHNIHKGYVDQHSTREPSKVDRDIDFEYRRVARSTLGSQHGSWLECYFTRYLSRKISSQEPG